MDFSHPETDIELKSLASDILNDFSSPERLKKLEADGPYFDEEVWKKLVETGVHAASLPTETGGIGLDYSATNMVAEAIGQTMISIPYIPCIVSTALPLLSAVSDSNILSVLEKVVSGESIITAGLIEPGNENTQQPLSTASQKGDSWVVDGSKHCVPYAAQSDAILVSALCEGNLWLGLVNTQQDAVELIAQQNTANEPQYHLKLNNANALCVAQGNEAKKIIQQSIAMTCVAYCSMAVGIAEKMTKIAAEYTSQREQFGVAIATFQAVAHRLANAYIDTECLKIITLKAASDVSQNKLDSEAISMAKVWCGDVLHRVSHSAQHVHGGTGIDRDYHLFRYCLWSKQLELSLGCSKVHIAKIADSIEAKYLAQV